MATRELEAIHDGRKSFYGKAKVITYDGDPYTYLRSYDTIVMALDTRTNELFRSAGQPESRTTCRHMVEFARQFVSTDYIWSSASLSALPTMRLN